MKYSGYGSMLKTLLFCLIALILLIHEAKSESFQGASSEATTLNSGPSSFSTNRIIATREGSVFLINQNTLFRMERDEGDVWERVAEDVQTASFDPRNDKIIYRVNSENQVTKSLDGGQKWISINNGLPRAKINFITVSPANSDDVFAGTELGLYKTSDGGFSWEPTALHAGMRALYINQISPAIRYALIGDGSIVVSTNSGVTWTRSETGLPSETIRVRGKPPTQITIKIDNLFLVAQDKPYLLATTSGYGLFRSDDNGASWKKSDTGLNQSERVSSIYFDSSQVILAGTSLATSSDGNSWTRLPILTTRFAPFRFDGIARHPKGVGFLVLFRYREDSEDGSDRIGYVNKDGILIGLSYGLLPRSNIASVWPGQYAGRRALFATVSNSTPTARGSATSVKNGTYYSVTGQYNVQEGAYFSVNEGVSWEYLFAPQCGTAITHPRGEPNDLWMYGSGLCPLRSQGEANGARASGALFQAANDAVSKIAFDPVDKDLLYYTAGVNVNSLYRYKYNRLTNQGQTVDLNLPASDVVVCEDNPKQILAGVGRFSTDGGWTWANKSASMSKYLTRNYGDGYRRGDLTLLSCKANEFRVLVYRSDPRDIDTPTFWVMKTSNLGETWETASSNPGQILRVFINPDDSANIFVVIVTYVAGQFSPRADAVKVLETNSSGNTWQEIYSYRLSKDDEYNVGKIVNVVNQVRQDKGRSLYVGGLIGLWRSDDEGKSWDRLGGIPQPKSEVLAQRKGINEEGASDNRASTGMTVRIGTAGGCSNAATCAANADKSLRGGQYPEAMQAWDKVLELGGSVNFLVCRETGFTGCKPGTFLMTTKEVSFLDGKSQQVFSAPLSEVEVKGAQKALKDIVRSDPRPFVRFKLKVSGKDYNFVFKPMYIPCTDTNPPTCDEPGLSQQETVANYIARKLQSLKTQ